ncbi:type-F conjugative transfer system pilin assembly protein TrbC [Sphingobium sp. SA916]|uniref:type-F conjugative transfer system pilin assembly protein TrbC n=1 Tax=Sphingobium sp. SA916 TaxID=1851207 RepID=UPI000CC00BE3|nr:type-F conjugative transfer system pilin assembly protein TrbC [Sphingobium sp. SA916]PNQ03985.1 conjugal transfer protein TrbC [Sphingobium sp. SA916]
MDRLADAIARSRTQPDGGSGPILPDVKAAAQRRRAFEGLRRRRPDASMEARARTAHDESEKQLAAQREEQAKALRQALGLEAPDAQALAGTMAKPTSEAKAWMPVIFASASMPISTLRAYAAQLERVQGVMAFRGMPGGLHKVGPMAKLSAEILRLDPGCEGPACAMRNVQLIVDPIVFRQHGIDQVPALAMVPGDPVQAYCERDDDSLRASHIVYGDSALPGLLEEIARLGGKEEVRHAQALLGSH